MMIGIAVFFAFMLGWALGRVYRYYGCSCVDSKAVRHLRKYHPEMRKEIKVAIQKEKEKGGRPSYEA